MSRADNNQKQIVTMLRQVGADVIILSQVGQGCPDLLVGWQGKNYLIEVKNPDTNKRGKLTKKQTILHSKFRGKIDVIYTWEQALNLLNIS